MWLMVFLLVEEENLYSFINIRCSHLWAYSNRKLQCCLIHEMNHQVLHFEFLLVTSYNVIKPLSSNLIHINFSGNFWMEPIFLQRWYRRMFWALINWNMKDWMLGTEIATAANSLTFDHWRMTVDLSNCSALSSIYVHAYWC